jgi:hypothetical protein|nr:MAG TPA: hypothetical protein [Caudoviricetes sp.]
MEEGMKEHKGTENLIPFNKRTKEERRKLAIDAGKASGEARRKKKKLRELVEMFGELPAPEKVRRVMKELGVSENDMRTNNMAVVVGLFQKAIKGDVFAFNAIRDIRGEKPEDKTKITGNMGNRIEIGFVEAGIEPASDESEVDV